MRNIRWSLGEVGTVTMQGLFLVGCYSLTLGNMPANDLERKVEENVLGAHIFLKVQISFSRA